ncbi:NlpC/P60 family protein [Paenibacillus sp. yr247]|uniref:C40 family peptidase n=1 Tax=Paenibacillus sp. yr247 TaxID=1761880 RepID=UPI000886425D|nr:C40 family peptidase [Paenibacillus sp. yr247]SDN37414.1 NlpC/P60 family protein [Paenibacillus sp. yr247]
MLAKKYEIAALAIALLVLFGFTMKNPENMELSAVFSNTNPNELVTSAPIQSIEQNSSSEVKQSDMQVSPQKVDTATDKETAIEVAKPSAQPKAEASNSELRSAPAKLSSSNAQSAAASPTMTPVPSPTAAPAPMVKANPVSEAPESTPTLDQPRDGDDPVPNAKNVNLSAAEIAKVVKQFEQLADSDQNEPSWKREADHLIVKGLGFLGTPYVYGAKTGQTDSFDCSSFLKYIFVSQGVSLPRDSRQQSQRGTEVSIDQLREGDLVFFTTPNRKNKSGIEHIGHVAVYLGNGLILHTFRPGIGVTVSELNGSWKERFVEARRVL